MTDDEFADYWAFLVEKKYSTKAALSSDERIFYAANTFRGSVPRSGLIGYFENTECDVIRDAHHALATLGLSEALRLLQEAQTIVLNGRSLPETDECLSVIDHELPEEELEQAMDDLDEKVRDVQNQLYLQDEAILDSLCRFAGCHCWLASSARRVCYLQQALMLPCGSAADFFGLVVGPYKYCGNSCRTNWQGYNLWHEPQPS